jgi:nucleoside-diphosphate-sugar epimerase
VTVVAVVGGSGFVGSAVVAALREEGREPVVVRAPRLRTSARDADALVAEAVGQDGRHDELTALDGADVVVIAAGVPAPAGTDSDELHGANALLPAVVLRAARRAGVRRVVHVSSVVVQGDDDVLDESSRRTPLSPYAESKARGEEALVRLCDEPGGPDVELVIYRPPSVQAPGRRVTRQVSRLARSPLRSVAGDGGAPTPLALIQNVGSAIAALCHLPDVPRYVLHPWEGLTAASVLELMGDGRRPRRIPLPVAHLVLRVARSTLGRTPGRVGLVRRLQVLWFGQQQAPSWLTTQGWAPPAGREGWAELAERVAADPGGADVRPAGAPRRGVES